MAAMTKQGWENRKKYEIEQFGSPERAAAIRRKKMQELGAKGGGSTKRDPATRSFMDIKIASKAGKKSGLVRKAKAWAEVERQRIVGGSEQ